MRLVTSLLLPMALAEPAPAVKQQVSECHDQLLEATKPDSTVDPCYGLKTFFYQKLFPFLIFSLLTARHTGWALESNRL